MTREKVIALEQRNRHLESELERLLEQSVSKNDLSKKYKDLKADYKELLETFERSEAIRHEQKGMIADQK